MLGRMLSHYEVQEKLGEGGMGVVWRARDTRLNRTVAIKTLPADKLADEGRKRRFIQEAQSASALNHPNIITIHDIASEGGVDFLVMEYVDGKTLGQLIPRRGMRVEELLRYAIQIADGLVRAHAAGIVHRDLKPGNIMVTSEGRVKLLDFGLAKLTEPAQPDDDARTRTIQTEDGAIVGTAAYMSPEQAESKTVDARSDIFSFGAVLYEMATGLRPFQGDSRLSTLSAVLRENPTPPTQVVPETPRELERIITRCLRKDPAKRFQAMPDLKVALEELKEESDSGTIEQAAGKVAATPSITKSRTLLAAAAVAALAVGGAAWFLLRPAAKPLPPMRSVPLTTYAGSERNATFSPDGSQVAFSWNGKNQDNWDIYVRLVDGGEPLRLTSNPAQDGSPAWSPDGRQIAFDRGNNIFSISPLGGAERKLVDGHAQRPSWTPDGRWLLYSTAANDDSLHSIARMDVTTGEVQRITSPPPQTTPGDGDYESAVSPDGKTLAFLRWVGNLGDVYVQPLAGGQARRVTKRSEQLGGLAWANDREIIFGRGLFGFSTLLRVAADGKSEPEAVAGVLDGAHFPVIARPPNGPARLAYGRMVADVNIWGVEIAVDMSGNVRTVAEPAALVASTRADLSPQFSPDGKRLAFASDRDGFREIWVSGSDGSNPVQLTTLKSTRCGSPNWSPDGRQIVFDSLASGSNDIWMVGSEGGPAKRLTTEPSDDARPNWSRDGRWIYFRSDRSGSQQIWKIPASEPFQPAVQVTRNGGFDVKSASDGKVYYTKTGGGLWSMPADGGDESAVDVPAPAGNWALTDNGIYYIDFKQSGHPVEWFSFAKRKSVPIVRAQKAPLGNTPNLAVSLDGRRIAWAQADRMDWDLMWIDNFR